MSALELIDVKHSFGRDGRAVQAVRGVTLEVDHGEVVALVGESGSGKSTLARVAVRLLRPSDGTVSVGGRDITTLRGRALRSVRSHIQMVFQDPFMSLDPLLRVDEAVAEPLVIHRLGPKPERSARAGDLLHSVGIDGHLHRKLPRELSGGQRQRVAIARALALDPSVLVCDEPVSALDVSVQAQVLNVLIELQERLRLACLFITHDLAVVSEVADRVAVMYLGRLVEVGTRASVLGSPMHPYTCALYSASPSTENGRRRIELQGEPPSPFDPPSGCGFRTRCWKATELCAAETPPLAELRPGHAVACHHPEPA